MAHVLNIEYGGGTVNLNSGNIRMMEQYVPRTGNGVDVTDSVELEFSGTAVADLQTAIQSVEDVMAQAVEFQQSGMGKRVFVVYQPDGAASASRSELIPANDSEWRLTLDSDSLSHARWMGTTKYVNGLLVWKRRDWWDGAETTVALTNSNGTATTDPLEIASHQDGAGADFYVEIAADQIAGSVKAPAILKFANTTDDANGVDNLYVGHFVASGSYEPPAGTALVMEGAGTADANCSGGEYAALSWADENETQLETWTIDSALYRARPYRMIARFQDDFAYTDLWLKVKLLSGATVIGETRWAQMSAGPCLQAIGNLKIPPFDHRAYVDLGDLTLALYSKRAAGAGTLNLDYLAALPLDSWRKYSAISGLPYGETLTDNPYDGTLVTDDGTDNTVTHQVEEGAGVLLWPGDKQRLYFLHDLTDGTAPIGRTATVQVLYRPRRRTL
jgi:hypothetical protein